MKRMKERDRESEKASQPDKTEVICPLIFKLTGLAVNYDLTWQPETKITVKDDEDFTSDEVTGVWKSNPVVRNHTQVFQQELQKMRETGEISWNESAYYFTHEEGIEARKAYEKKVLSGEIKAHITSWGPNPKKANDKSRFHKFTGVTFEELRNRFPELYNPKPTAVPVEPREEHKETVTETEETEAPKDLVTEPTEKELKEIDEERVAAATTPEATIEDLVADGEADEEDDHSTIILYANVNMDNEDINTDSISWKSVNGEEMRAYLMELPELETEMWLSEGQWRINGYKYEVRVER